MLQILPIVENIILLTFLGLGYYLIEGLRPAHSKYKIAALHGISFGLVAFFVTSTPVAFGDGATVDARAAPIILAGYIGGPVAALISGALGALARGLVGGNFSFSGMIVYGVYATIGILFWLRLSPRNGVLFQPRIVAAMCLASAIGAAAMFFLIQPDARALAWLQYDLPFIILANCLGIIFAAAVLSISQTIIRNNRELQDVYETLRLAKRAGGFGVWDFDVETGKLNWDERSKTLHGIVDNGFTGTYEDWVRNLHPDDLARAQDTFAKALKNSGTFEVEYRVNLQDGRQNIIKGDGVIIRNAKGDAIRVVGANLDLTGLRATEAQLQESQLIAMQAQKFDTIGQLTGGVAHDFNNLLAVIMGNLELIEDQIHRDKLDINEVHDLIDASLQATRRGAGLTQNMLAYARKARLTPEDIDMNDMVRETESWMRRTIPSKIEIETNLQAGLWLTRADKSSLQSALVNLLVNARDAFDASGQVTIETSNMRVNDEFIEERKEDIAPGRYVMLAVSDTGSGIDPAIIANIFDPFFTTKTIGEGSGLGLSMVQGFVKQSGGAIRVYSEPGVGTSFKLYFPAITDENGRDKKTALPADDTQSHETNNSRILLVEDRAEVLLVLKKTLESAGYEVVTATSGDAGFALFRRDQQFDLIVTDIVMPGDLQGPTMAKKIRALDPSAKFVFLSGYASEATVHGNGLMPKDVRLMKPVSREDLLAAVSQVLLH